MHNYVCVGQEDCDMQEASMHNKFHVFFMFHKPSNLNIASVRQNDSSRVLINNSEAKYNGRTLALVFFKTISSKRCCRIFIVQILGIGLYTLL